MEECNTAKNLEFWSHQDYPFTQFAHELLLNEQAQKAFLHLQHHSGFNINLILYALWLAKSRYGRLTKRNFDFLQASIHAWHQQILVELKYTYALLSEHLSDLAVNIKKQLQTEIERAHLIEQRMLFESNIKTKTLRRNSQQQLKDACTSLIHYCELKNDLLAPEDKAALTQLLCHVFHDLDESAILAEVDKVFDRMQKPELSPVQLMWESF